MTDSEIEANTQSECTNCGATDRPENYIYVGFTDAIGTSVCTDCLSEHLYQWTVLSQRESSVASHIKITGASPTTIAERLGIARSTVHEYRRRIREKVEKSRETVEVFGEE